MATTKVLRKQFTPDDVLHPAAGNGSGEYRALASVPFEAKANAPSQHIRTF
jgi:hypothetical protein